MSVQDRFPGHDTHHPARGEPSPRFVSLITKNTYALVLAGGRGSRLKNLTDWRAKPAVPFGGKFRIIDFPLSNCVNSGIRRMGVVTQYKSHSLIQHIQRGWSFLHGHLRECVDLLPAQQMTGEDWYQGTADAVYQNIDILRGYEPEFVLVLAGDHVYKMDYGKMLAFHVARSADMSVACIEVPTESARDFGVLAVDEDARVTGFLEKPQDPPHIPGRPGVTLASMGIYAFNTKFLYEQLIRDRDDPNSNHDFGKDVIPYALQQCRVYAHRFVDSCVNMVGDIPYWRDVGTVDAYYAANLDLTKLMPELNLYDEDWPIWTHQAQLPPAKFVFDDDSRRGASLDSMVSGGCVISGSTLRRSLLFSNVHIHSYCTIEDSVILPDVEVNRYAVLKRVILDRGCKIPPGMRIGVDPEEDRKRFYVSESGVTLVTPEMLGQAMHLVR